MYRSAWIHFGIVGVLGGAAAAQPQEPAAEEPPAEEPAPPEPPEPAPAPPAAPPAIVHHAGPPPGEGGVAPGSGEGERSRPAPWSFELGGFVQPQLRLRENSPAPFDQDGFRFARARLTGTGKTRIGPLEVRLDMEVGVGGSTPDELIPAFTIFDAFGTVAADLPAGGRLAVELGQFRVPISRQGQLSDTRLAFVDKALLSMLIHDRDLGGRFVLDVPALPRVRIAGGVFNGEGKNQVENINEAFLYTARVEVTPLGRPVPLAESAFAGPYLTIAGSYAHNELRNGDRNDLVTHYGVDVAGAWNGISGSFEYLLRDTKYEARGTSTVLPMPFRGNGWAAQLSYLLPFALAPARAGRVEVGARVEELDRNDTIPIVQAGEPDQSVRAYTAVLSYYLREHSLKAQLAVTRFDEIEDRTVTGLDATYANDQLMLQLTYRPE